MWHLGLLQLSWWEVALVTLGLTHATIIAVTVYLHRHSAHRALDLHPGVAHVFRFWLWLTTGMNTKGWTAVHRKHHANCETPEDPHSPVIEGLSKVLWEGAELYRAAHTEEVMAKYGKGTPDDWIERNLYVRHSFLGIFIMLAVDLLLFGALGLTVWAVQMAWIPFFAAGVINGVCHHTGYRNFESPDASTNLVPWGIVIGGEELHNNHHTYPSSAKFSVKWWELDVGWSWIRAFELLGLAHVKRLPPVVHEAPGKQEIDLDTIMAIINNRFQVMAQYTSTVVAPLVEQERSRADRLTRHLFARAKALLSKNDVLIDDRARRLRARLLAESQVLEVIYEKRLELQQLWENRNATRDELVAAFREWCGNAESSGIQALEQFAAQLRSYTTAPRPAGA